MPVSLGDAIEHLRLTHSDHNFLIEDLIRGAVHAFEQKANVCLSEQSWKAFLKKGYDEIELWKYPITSITSIRYYDDDNAIQTLSTDDYYTNIDSGSLGYNPRPTLIYIEDVPSTYERDDAMIITFQAGYTAIDYDVKQAILSWVYRKYENPNDPVTERLSFFDTVIADHRSYGL